MVIVGRLRRGEQIEIIKYRQSVLKKKPVLQESNTVEKKKKIDNWFDCVTVTKATKRLTKILRSRKFYHFIFLHSLTDEL